jgi:hypothetical protein
MKNTGFTYFSFFLVMFYSCSTFGPNTRGKKESFRSDWPVQTTRYWIGPEYWTNPLQDWHLNNGRLECLVAAENRNVHILTHQLGDQSGNFDMQITVGMLSKPQQAGWAGFLVGASGEFDDYRDNAIYGKGLEAGILTTGKLFIGKVDIVDFNAPEAILLSPMEKKGITLKLQAVQKNEIYQVTLKAYDTNSRDLLGQIEKEDIPANDLIGNLAIVSSFPDSLIGIASGAEVNGTSENIGSGKFNAQPGFWFNDWQLSGDKIVVHDDQTFGPIMWSQYTVSKGVLKMTAQMAPVGKEDDPGASRVKLQIKGEGNDWQTIQESPVSAGSRVAIFRVDHWRGTTDIDYRLAFKYLGAGDKMKEHYWHGTVKKDPVGKKEVVVAAFTGNTDLGFPNNEVVKHVKAHKPDLLIFTGDQIYEPVGGYGIEREPLEKATLDYLRKWYLYGWEYRELLKDIPSLALPDDHDVYQGNIWGAGGKATNKEGSQKDMQDSGGYTMPPEWVNIVQQTQTGHFPDPFDPAPVTHGISVYYCDLQLGGISFGVIEDRKWKSAPGTVLPANLKVRNGWAEASRTVDPKILDVPEAELLGKRQIEFIKDWASDWSGGVWMKTLVSQTIFSTIATLPNDAVSDVVVPTLRITKRGEYPEGDIPTQDMDSNGWPQKGRNEALREIRKGYAFHIAGDQHLGSSLQYGIDDWGDAGYAICVPSISNIWPRRWFPEQGGKNRKPGAPKNTGDFLDGFGNKMTVLAVSNPYFTNLKPANLYDRAAGYGIIKFNRESREIEFANWPRQTDPTQPGAKPYGGWPITIQQEDNYGRKAVAYLPEIQVTGLSFPPVIQVIDESTEEIVYTLRAKENTFKPKVFKSGFYTIKVGEPGTNKMKTLVNVSDTKDEAKKVMINF